MKNAKESKDLGLKLGKRFPQRNIFNWPKMSDFIFIEY
jgi:hypothetical protein